MTGVKEDSERFSKALDLIERGKVHVEGLFENSETEEVTSDKLPQLLKQKIITNF